MAVIGHKISTKMFFYHKEDKSFSQEASSINIPLLGQLYDDACDEGFVLVSERTGAEIPMYLTKTERDREGDVQCWNFKSASRKPNEKDITVCVFND